MINSFFFKYHFSIYLLFNFFAILYYYYLMMYFYNKNNVKTYDSNNEEMINLKIIKNPGDKENDTKDLIDEEQFVEDNKDMGEEEKFEKEYKFLNEEEIWR